MMRSAETLEDLYVTIWVHGAREARQEARRDFFLDLLCTVKNLQRLTGRDDGERSIHEIGVEVHAADAFRQHIEDGRDRTWALGPSMRVLHMQVVGVPRPDVLWRCDSTPLKPWMVDVLDNSRRYEVQRWVYEQLGRMTGLEELVLGMVDVCFEGLGDYMPEDDDDDMTTVEFLTQLEDAMEDDDWLHRFINYQCLEFSLESGLELLGGLKELRMLDVKSTAHRIGVAELEWMHVNWPKLKEIKDLVSERTWAGDAEDGLVVMDAVEEWMEAHPHGIGSSFYAGASSA
ncbi:hypothetical protein BGZ96_010911 [Linnemannia gamsii]|uniref:Uncharacterized protein n=1 Tax=Linnemannia gamsii TaxID=64522 RepID=A0ABQ7JTP7_9FUNG|nr:hypothetical protein BGZ96_010911 [Linnemannia gamsii]